MWCFSSIFKKLFLYPLKSRASGWYSVWQDQGVPWSHAHYCFSFVYSEFLGMMWRHAGFCVSELNMRQPSHSDAGWGSLSSKGKLRPWVCVGSFKMYCWPFHGERGQLGHHKAAGGLSEECFCTRGLATIPVPAAAVDKSAVLISWIYAESPCHHDYYSVHMPIVPALGG